MKSCKEDHHLETASSIRLGTLVDFRANPDPEVGDDQEAALSTQVEIRTPRVLPCHVLERALPCMIDFGTGQRILWRRFYFNLETCTPGPIANGRVLIERFNCFYKTEGSDALIFCMTSTNDPEESPRLNYGSSWKMKRSEADLFGKELLSQLNKRFKQEPEHFLDRQAWAGKLRPSGMKFALCHGLVTYRPRDLHLVDPTLAELDQLGHLLANPDMVKAESYRHQDEYRFCFRLISNDRIINLRSDLEYLFLDASPFRKFLL